MGRTCQASKKTTNRRNVRLTRSGTPIVYYRKGLVVIANPVSPRVPKMKILVQRNGMQTRKGKVKGKSRIFFRFKLVYRSLRHLRIMVCFGCSSYLKCCNKWLIIGLHCATDLLYFRKFRCNKSTILERSGNDVMTTYFQNSKRCNGFRYYYCHISTVLEQNTGCIS
jgi:hypothetical protein